MVNDAAEKIIDMSRDVILKENIPTILKKYNVRDIEKTNEKLLRIINEGAIIRDGEITISKNLYENYKSVNILYNVYPIKNEQGKISGTVVSFLDITDRVEKQNKIDYMTYHDSLTGTFNRSFFTNEINNIDIKENLPISIIMGDVNGLKLTNDAFGHLLGDKLLITAVEVMKKSCNENDLIVRWGGDEFIILLPNTDEKQVQKISDRIKSECENERIDSIALSISIGYSTKSSIEEDIMKVINTSEDMMYRIKMVESRSQKSKTLKVITQTLQEKSFQDVEHSKNVSKLCRIIGKEMGMSSKELSELEILGDIHDIGKVTINEDVLNKKGVLNSEEWKDVKKHSEVGYHIALSSPELSFLADSILAHHERYDGFGYPKGLKGEEIPQYSRMLAIADAFDSMAGYRVYRNKMSKREIINEFKDCSGKHFDPKLVKVFIDKVVENKWIQDIYFKVDN
ncbi:hypothetical protein SDC9_95452 [bioreactor metagenome]|uniref:Uncharacterized protein n=1 Tax=bioreactor metagenome TaxID=1076179 RepID=A0A645A6C5_9ZZZZ